MAESGRRVSPAPAAGDARSLKACGVPPAPPPSSLHSSHPAIREKDERVGLLALAPECERFPLLPLLPLNQINSQVCENCGRGQAQKLQPFIAVL